MSAHLLYVDAFYRRMRQPAVHSESEQFKGVTDVVGGGDIELDAAHIGLVEDFR